MKEKYIQVLFDLCASEITAELSDDNQYAEARKLAYEMEMNLGKEFNKAQFEKIKTLLEETEKVSLAESERLFEMAFNLGIRIAMNAFK